MTERGDGNQGRSEAAAQFLASRYLNEAARMNSILGLEIAIGLSDRKDVESMRYSMAIRFARNDIYNTQLVRRMPIRNLSFRGGLARLSSGLAEKTEKCELALASLDKQFLEHVEENYSEDLYRPRTIDLAVNDFVALSTVQEGQFVIIKPDVEAMIPWMKRWKERLSVES